LQSGQARFGGLGTKRPLILACNQKQSCLGIQYDDETRERTYTQGNGKKTRGEVCDVGKLDDGRVTVQVIVSWFGQSKRGEHRGPNFQTTDRHHVRRVLWGAFTCSGGFCVRAWRILAQGGEQKSGVEESQPKGVKVLLRTSQVSWPTSYRRENMEKARGSRN